MAAAPKRLALRRGQLPPPGYRRVAPTVAELIYDPDRQAKQDLGRTAIAAKQAEKIVEEARTRSAEIERITQDAGGALKRLDNLRQSTREAVRQSNDLSDRSSILDRLTQRSNELLQMLTDGASSTSLKAEIRNLRQHIDSLIGDIITDSGRNQQANTAAINQIRESISNLASTSMAIDQLARQAGIMAKNAADELALMAREAVFIEDIHFDEDRHQTLIVITLTDGRVIKHNLRPKKRWGDGHAVWTNSSGAGGAGSVTVIRTTTDIVLRPDTGKTLVLVDASAGPVQITLPTAVARSWDIDVTVKRKNIGGSDITVMPKAGEYIDESPNGLVLNFAVLGNTEAFEFSPTTEAQVGKWWIT